MLTAPVSRTQVICRWNFFSILVTVFRGWHKSTMIRWRRLSRAATAPGSWYNSTRAAGGNSPVFIVAECRRAVRKFSSSLELAKLPALSSTRRGLPVNCSSHTPAPCCKHPTTVAAPTMPFISRGHMIKQKRWALGKATVALAKASSRWDCFSSVESSWKLYPRPSVRKPISFGQGAPAVLSYLHTTWLLLRSPFSSSLPPNRSYLTHTPYHSCCGGQPNSHFHQLPAAVVVRSTLPFAQCQPLHGSGYAGPPEDWHKSTYSSLSVSQAVPKATCVDVSASNSGYLTAMTVS